MSIFSDSLFNDVNGYYASLYHSNDFNQNKTRNSNEQYLLNKSEFSFPRVANSLGFPDKEWQVQKSTNSIRIICLGDSFTEGEGAEYNNTYVNKLQERLKNHYPFIEVFNAGTCGSDPFINFRNLKEILIKYEPDIILQSFTTNDYFQDFVTRGGNERFQEDGTLKYRKKIWWERLYAVNYTIRILVHTFGGYNKLLLKKDECSKIYTDIESKTVDLFKAYQSFANDNQIELLVFTLPFKQHLSGSVEEEVFHQKFKQLFRKFNLNFHTLNPCYQDHIKATHTNYKDYYWKTDGHHNSKGYEMMAKCMEEIVTPVIEKRIVSKNTLLN